MSGHSKWSQIKHKKAITDAKRGQAFSRVVREISIAAREGGANPDMNVRLRAAVERAKAAGLPKENIEKALLKASGEGGEELHEFLYEASAGGGVAILIEGVTDNTNRSYSEIRHLLAGRGVKMAEPGSLLWNFEKVGTIELSPSENSTRALDDLELLIIDAGARDIRKLDGAWIVETEFQDTQKIRSALANVGVTIRSTGHDFVVKSPIDLPSSEEHSIDAVLEELSQYDDVEEVYTNIHS